MKRPRRKASPGLTRRSESSLRESLRREARQLARVLARTRARLVLAESCTGGMAAATLAEIPGISEYFCGSAVVYRNETKSRWIKVSRASIRRYTAVSTEVARQMAQNSLARTPEAAIGAAITGHLGPSAPKNQSGRIVICVAFRRQKFPIVWEGRILPDAAHGANSLRRERQLLASHAILSMVRSLLEHAELKTHPR